MKTHLQGGYAAWQLDINQFSPTTNNLVPRSIKPNLITSGEKIVNKRSFAILEKRYEFRTETAIQWCEEAWKLDGELNKCQTTGEK